MTFLPTNFIIQPGRVGKSEALPGVYTGKNTICHSETNVHKRAAKSEERISEAGKAL